MVRSEENIVEIIRDDHFMMEILKAAQSLDIPDWWVCSGFVQRGR